MTEAQNEPVRILALTGGGCRGLSPLHILNRIMKDIARRTGKEGQDLKPCDYFDLIGGTSVGGISAIMLGRLGMTVPESIAAFKKLAKFVFKDGKKQGVSMFRYKSSYLVNAVKEVLGELGLPADEPLYNPSENGGCRTFITALPKACATGNSRPILFRSYPAPKSQFEKPDTKIWEAVRAATAAPGFFKPLCKDGCQFIDAAVCGFNDPSCIVEEQAKDIWPDREIGVFVSLGTGKRSSEGFYDRGIIDFFESLWTLVKHTATGTEIAAGQLQRRLGRDIFFRFSTGDGLGNIHIADWRKLGDIEEKTNYYLEEIDTEDRVERLALKITVGGSLPPQPLRTIGVGGNVISSEFLMPASETNYSYAAQKFRSTAYKHIIEGFQSHSEAIKFYKEMLSYRKDGKMSEARTSEVRSGFCFRRASDQIGRAFVLLLADFDATMDPKAMSEVWALKVKLVEVVHDSQSLLSPKYSNDKCAELLRELEINRINSTPKPHTICSRGCRKIPLRGQALVRWD